MPTHGGIFYTLNQSEIWCMSLSGSTQRRSTWTSVGGNYCRRPPRLGRTVDRTSVTQNVTVQAAIGGTVSYSAGGIRLPNLTAIERILGNVRLFGACFGYQDDVDVAIRYSASCVTVQNDVIGGLTGGRDGSEYVDGLLGWSTSGCRWCN
jgi:hypothetical protein